MACPAPRPPGGLKASTSGPAYLFLAAALPFFGDPFTFFWRRLYLFFGDPFTFSWRPEIIRKKQKTLLFRISRAGSVFGHTVSTELGFLVSSGTAWVCVFRWRAKTKSFGAKCRTFGAKSKVPEARFAFRIRLADILVAARANRLWAGRVPAGGRSVVASLGRLTSAWRPGVWLPGCGSAGPGGMAAHIWCKRFCVF